MWAVLLLSKNFEKCKRQIFQNNRACLKKHCLKKKKKKKKKKATWLMKNVFKIICVTFGAILMFHYRIMPVKLKQLAKIWHSKVHIFLGALFNKINILCNNILLQIYFFLIFWLS